MYALDDSSTAVTQQKPLARVDQKDNLVRVSGINESISEARLTTFFSNRKRGGPILSVVVDSKTVVIDFKEHSG